MGWIIKDAAGNITGTIEKVAEGSAAAGCIMWAILAILALPLIGIGCWVLVFWGWIWLARTGIKKPTIVKSVLILLGVGSLVLAILYLPSGIGSDSSDSSGSMFENVAALSIMYLIFGGLILGIVAATRESSK